MERRRAGALSLITVLLVAGLASPGWAAIPKSDLIKFEVGGILASSVNFRGVVLYPFPTLLPLITLELLNGHFILQERGMGGRAPYLIDSDQFDFQWGVQPVYDTVWITPFRGQRGTEKTRKLSLELMLDARVRPVRWIELRGAIFQDLIEHFGHYGEFGITTTVFYTPSTIIQLVSEIGLGNDAHNTYLYGSDETEGPCAYRAGAVVIFPKLLPPAKVAVGLFGAGVLSRGNRRGKLLAHNPDQMGGGLLISVPLHEIRSKRKGDS